MNSGLAIAILCFVVFYFIFGRERDKDAKVKREQFLQDSKDMLKVLLEDDHREKLEKIVDRTKGDMANIKILSQTYQLTAQDAKTLWDSIKNK